MLFRYRNVIPHSLQPLYVQQAVRRQYACFLCLWLEPGRHQLRAQDGMWPPCSHTQHVMALPPLWLLSTMQPHSACRCTSTPMAPVHHAATLSIATAARLGKVGHIVSSHAEPQARTHSWPLGV